MPRPKRANSEDASASFDDSGNIPDQPVPQKGLNRRRRPSSKPKGRTVSADTVDALKKMDESIEKATRHLKKMPGSREPDARASLNKVLWHPDYCDELESFDLCFHDETIKVCCTTEDPLHDHIRQSYHELDSYDVSMRLKLCAFVPDLIMAAKSSELKIKQAAEDVIASIEQAIAQTTEVDE